MEDMLVIQWALNSVERPSNNSLSVIFWQSEKSPNLTRDQYHVVFSPDRENCLKVRNYGSKP